MAGVGNVKGKILSISGVLFLFATFFSILPLDRALDRYAGELKDTLFHWIRDRYGVDIQYDSISPSLLRSLDIRNLVISFRNYPGLKIRLANVSIRYRLFTLMRGNWREGIEEIEMNHGYVEADETEMIRLREQVGSVLATLPVEEGPSSRLPQIKGRRFQVVYRAWAETIQAKDLFFTLFAEEELYSLRLKGAVAYNKSSTRAPLRSLRSHVELESWFRYPFKRMQGNLLLQGLETDTFLLEKQSLQFSLDQTRINLTRKADAQRWGLSVTYQIPDQRVFLTFSCENFTPSSVLYPKDGFPYEEALDTILSGNGEIEYHLKSGELSYSGQFKGLIPYLVLQTPTRGEAVFRGNTEKVFIDSLFLQNEFGKVYLSGTFNRAEPVFQGQMAWNRLTYQTSYPLSGEAEVLISPMEISLEGPLVSWGKVQFHDYHFHGRFPEGILHGLGGLDARFSLTKGSSPIQLYAVFPERSFLHAAGGVRVEKFPLLDAFPLLEQLGMEPMEELREGVPLLRASCQLYLRIDPDGFEVDAPAVTLWEEQRGDHRAEGSVRFSSDGAFRIPSATLSWEQYQGRVSIQGRYSPKTVFEFETELHFLNETYQFHALLDLSGYARIQTLSNQKLEVFWDRPTGVFGTLSLDNLVLPFSQGQEAWVSGIADFFLEGQEKWVLDIRQGSVVFPSLVSQGPVEVSIQGILLPGKAVLSSLNATLPWVKLRGNGSVLFSWDDAAYEGRFLFYGEEGWERYGGSLVYRGNELSFDLEVDQVPLQRWLSSQGVSGIASGRMRGNNVIQTKEVAVDLRVQNGKYRGNDFEGRFSGRISEQNIVAQNLELKYSDLFEFRGTSTLDLTKGSVSWGIDLQLSFLDKPALARAEGALFFNLSQGTSSVLDLASLPPTITRGNAAFSFKDERLPLDYRRWTMEILAAGEEISFSGGPFRSIEGKFHWNGSFSLQVKDPIPVTFQAMGLLEKEGRFRASVRNIQSSLETFKSSLDFGVFKISQGIVNGDLFLVGTLQDPSFYGELRVESVKAWLEILPEELEPVKASLRFQDKTITLNPLTVRTRGGNAQVGGTFELEKYSLVSAKIWVDTGPAGGVRIKADFSGVQVEGIGKGRVEILVEGEEVQVTGKVNASNTKLTLGELRFDQPMYSNQEVKLSLNLELETGKLVEFVWPSETFPIIRTYAALGQRLNIQLDTQSGFFLIRGNIGIRGGQVYYADRIFYMREGRIVFNERENRFDPVISVRAEIRESTQAGIVRIFLVADNTRLSQFSPRFESEPVLSQLEIISLLGGSNFLVTGTQEAVNLTSALLLTGDLFLQSEIIQSFERSMRNRFNLDLFAVRTQIFQNVLSDILQPQEVIPLHQSVPSLGKYLDKSSVFLGKYIGSDLFLEYLIQLRAESPLANEIRSFGGMNIESEILFEWKTPFFTLGWSFRPKNPEELFIRDNTLFFRWRYAF